MDQWLVVNAARFPHETVDGETVLIDAETGRLLLLTGLASVLWGHLVAGAQTEALTAAVEARFGSEAAAATRDFLQDLRAADILVATSEPGQAAGAAQSWPDRYTAPAIERYDDIANIIAMDPIHEVGAAGWPRGADTRGS
jgi:hypothetical protein